MINSFDIRMHGKRLGIRPDGRHFVVDTGVHCGMDSAGPGCRIQRQAFVNLIISRVVL
jgi:hypothetical protein